MLSPHNLEPMPRDGRRPTEQDILIAGVYNLGFLGIGAGAFADELLDWWAERLRARLHRRPRARLLRRPALDGPRARDGGDASTLLRDPGFNVAYWNLRARPRVASATAAGGSTATRRCGCSTSAASTRAARTRLSKHQDRIVPRRAPRPARGCAASYAEELLGRRRRARRAAGPTPTPSTRVRGRRSTCRRAPAVPRAAARGRRRRRRSTPDGRGGVPRGRSTRRPTVRRRARRHAATWRRSTSTGRDLQRAYPDLDGDGRGRLPRLGARLRARARSRSTTRCCPPVAPPPRTSSARCPGTRRAAPPLGVNVAGYLSSELGVGEVARQAIERARRRRASPRCRSASPRRTSRARPRVRRRRRPAAPGYPINLVCVNADMLPAVRRRRRARRSSRDRHTIGWWWWEVVDVPGALARLVRATSTRSGPGAASSPRRSRRSRRCRSCTSHCRCARARAPRAEPRGARAAATASSSCSSSTSTRVMRAQEPARADRGVPARVPGRGRGRLARPQEHQRRAPPGRRTRGVGRGRASGHPHVRLHRPLRPSAADKNRLIASCDATSRCTAPRASASRWPRRCCSASRSIATGYSGNLDFMTPENSWPGRLRAARRSARAPTRTPPTASGPSPDLDHAAALHARGLRRPRRRRRGAARARRGDVARGALARRPRRGDRARACSDVARATAERAVAPARATRASARRARRARSRTRGSRPRRAAGRRARGVAPGGAARDASPHTAHQAGIDRELAAGLHDAGRRARRRRAAPARRRDRDRCAGCARSRRRLARARAAGDGIAEPAVARARDARVDDLRAPGRRAAAAIGLTAASGRCAHRRTSRARRRTRRRRRSRGRTSTTSAHRAFVARELDDAVLLRALPRRRARCPTASAAASTSASSSSRGSRPSALGGRVLDAGSTLNHLPRPRRACARAMDDLHIVTLAPEERSRSRSSTSPTCTPTCATCRSRDGTYDRVLSISTLEHVGMDNELLRQRRAGAPTDPQPERAARRARAAPRRSARAASCYLTVPGRPRRALRVGPLAHARRARRAGRGVRAGERRASRTTATTPRRLAARRARRGRRRALPRPLLERAARPHRVVAAEAVACVRIETRE